MALKLPAAEAANVAIQSIGCGYDILLNLRLKYRKGDYSSDAGLIKIEIAVLSNMRRMKVYDEMLKIDFKRQFLFVLGPDNQQILLQGYRAMLMATQRRMLLKVIILGDNGYAIQRPQIEEKQVHKI
ncbi:hypothetical protein LXL04_001211 [Taraxacum kok-saghyz]